MTDKITLKNVFKIYGGAPGEALELLEQGADKDEIRERTGQIVGVDDVSFGVRAGEIFVVMGLSGCGKSTLVRTINRLIEPTSGQILIDGRDVTALSKNELIALRRRQIVMVFQSFALMPHLTVRENAAFGLDVAGVDGTEANKRALEALETVGLGGYADSRPHELSGGMRQRVGLARALAVDPSIMLMDEAFSALDPLIRTEMQDELVRLQRRDARTIVFISHDLDEAIRIGDRVAVMDRGRIVQIGTPDEIVQSPANDYVRSFFKGVDVSKVLVAGDVCGDDQTTLESVSAGEALAALAADGGQFAYLIDSDGRFEGVTSRARLEGMVAQDGLGDALLADVDAVAADTPVERLLAPVAAAPCPVPVIDDEGRYVGAVSRSALLLALDRTG